MTLDEFKRSVATAKKRVSGMDAIDGFKDRFLETILAALKAGIMYPDTNAQFDAYVMLDEFLTATKKVDRIIKNAADQDPVAEALSLNLHCRHLSPSQLAMVADKVRGIYDEEAKAAKVEGGKTAGSGRKKDKANLPEPNKPAKQSRDKAAEAVGVSGKLADAGDGAAVTSFRWRVVAGMLWPVMAAG